MSDDACLPLALLKHGVEGTRTDLEGESRIYIHNRDPSPWHCRHWYMSRLDEPTMQKIV